MIVRDEEAVLARILSDVKPLFDEMVIVDTGSVDRTREIAESFGARVVDFEWIDDFAAARNRSFEECTSEWIFWLDADDRVPPASVEILKKLKSSMPEEHDSIWLRYRYAWADHDPDVCVISHSVPRIVRRRRDYRWVNPIHEMLVTKEGNIGYTDAWIEHRSLASQRERKLGRNLRILEALNKKDPLDPHILMNLGRELIAVGRVEEAVEKYRDFLIVEQRPGARATGLVNLAACLDFLGNHDEKLEILQEAINIDVGRAEAWMLLGCHYFNRGEWDSAIPFYQAAGALRPPNQGLVEEAAYLWGPADFLSICMGHTGRLREALQNSILAMRRLGDRPRLRANAKSFAKALRSQS